MAMFASVEDLADYLQTDFTDEDRVRVTRLIEAASAVIQRAARQTFELVTDDEITLLATGTNLLMVPELPVVSIDSITVADTVIDTDNYLFTSSGLIYARPETSRWVLPAEVVYTHGYSQVPDDIVAVVVDMSARAWQNPRGVLSEQIGTYSARYPNNRTGLSLLPDEEMLVRSYRPAPG